ncbi:hypothetical protein E2C01_079923 [Portunus trituberculatus]|uniref:Uncharacterized protein n=1 Tax=Portunus trituberculatus TaxID=210409 RepID=A0A5B7IKS9_PORTR|nr:hypothetical protein [Portunus trituberculatus]
MECLPRFSHVEAAGGGRRRASRKEIERGSDGSNVWVVAVVTCPVPPHSGLSRSSSPKLCHDLLLMTLFKKFRIMHL